jgi:hypothetical protein
MVYEYPSEEFLFEGREENDGSIRWILRKQISTTNGAEGYQQ